MSNYGLVEWLIVCFYLFCFFVVVREACAKIKKYFQPEPCEPDWSTHDPELDYPRRSFRRELSEEEELELQAEADVDDWYPVIAREFCQRRLRIYIPDSEGDETPEAVVTDAHRLWRTALALQASGRIDEALKLVGFRRICENEQSAA